MTQQADEVVENELVEELEPVEEVTQEESSETTEDAGPEPEADEVVVTIGEESPPSEEAERAPEWVRELRKRNQETVKENRELKKKLESLQAPEKAVVLGAKPTLEACEYDTDKFEAELTQWHERKRAAEAEAAKKQDDAAKAQQAWQAQLDTYGKQKSELKVQDFEDAETVATDLLSTTQQGIVVSGAENPAVVIYALGKNPKKAKELASIADPVKFAFAVAKLETQMKVTPRKAAPIPESTVRGNARVSAGIDSTLERLRAEADRTGDRSKVASYMRQQSRAK